MTQSIIHFFMKNKLVAVLLLVLFTAWGISTAPFDWDTGFLPRNPVPVDAIPDIGENQQIIFTEWDGRSPQDVEDQITYPLTTELLGLPGVRTVRSNSMFGYSSINIIFEEGVEFYWSRARILEKLNALPGGTLPDGVQPALGPDATALGQVFWYTLEGLDSDGNPTGGWDLNELRSIQDYQVRYGISATKGVAEVASIGGFVREYQVDIDPAAMYAANVNVQEIANAVRKSNLDVGARTIEMNRAEYVVRGLGYIRSLEDIEESVVAVRENVPIRIKDVARVALGPAQRRGMLDKGGAEAVGGVVVARYGENPLAVIQNVKEKIAEISPGLPTKTLADGTVSQVQIVPFYDRTGLIYETLGTLEEALTLQILITIVVVVIMLINLRSAFLVSALLPVAVLMSFILMKYIGIDANVVALAGIAISIGVVVDMGIILTENMIRRMEENPGGNRFDVIYDAAIEVSPAIITALMTTIVSFLPVFMLQEAEGKLFGPLAFTKTFVLFATLIISVTLIPAFAHWLFSRKAGTRNTKFFWNSLMAIAGLAILFVEIWAGLALLALASNNLYVLITGAYTEQWRDRINTFIIVLSIGWLLAVNWLPMGPAYSLFSNLIYVLLIVFVVLGLFLLFIRYYEWMLASFLENRTRFLILPALILLFGLMSWRGFDRTFHFFAVPFEAVGWEIKESGFWSSSDRKFPGLNREFMPKLDEGSFLVMPTTMPHAGMEEVIDAVRKMDMQVASIPEVETVVGKVGRVESALDPAPISMFENVVIYKSEYKTDERGRRVRFAVDREGEFIRDDNDNLIPDSRGRFYRQWRDEINSPDDIWNEILGASKVPGITSAPKLQPIETRIVMLQTGMRANIGLKVSGPDLRTIDDFSIILEDELRNVPGVRTPSVFADRVVGKPYIEIDINREEIARHGLSVGDVQEVIALAIGGMPLTTTVEGRERYPVRVRYAREYRNTPERMAEVLVPAAGYQIPLGQLAEIRFTTGPMGIRSENTFLVNYVTFDNEPGITAVETVENVRRHLNERISSGELVIPAGVSYTFEGEFRNQQRASERLGLILPITLVIIFLLIYFQFRSAFMTGIIFSGIIVAWAGGFVMLWLYGQPWFLDFSIFGVNQAELLQVQTINLSVAVWVGFLVLFGIAVDDGVVMATYLKQSFEKVKTNSVEGIRKATVAAGLRRVRPCLMTTATTLLALLPILTSSGKGADIMIPMAVPIFGGMLFQLITLFIVPVLFSAWMEFRLNRQTDESEVGL
jgi:Cu(I)/Ag(I) efflux system membrane protein CusA/SilA